MCNLKQTPQSNWWSNGSTPLYDTTGLGMVLWLQQPPERALETSYSLPRRGMLQYLPFSAAWQITSSPWKHPAEALTPPEGLMSKLPPAVPHGATLGGGWRAPALAAGLGTHCRQRGGKALLRHFVLTISPATGWGPAGRNHHPAPHLRALLPPSSAGTPPAPAGPRQIARSSPRTGCWSRL